MTMHGVAFSKGDGEGVVQAPVGVFSGVPWWSAIGPQSTTFNEPLISQSKSGSSVENPASGNQVTATKQDQALLGKGPTTQFNIFSGDSKSSGEGHNLSQLQTATSVQAPAIDYRGHFELGFGQPLICGKYPYGEQFYGVFSTYGPQVTGRIMLPLNLTNDEGPIFVNPKQYHGIMRRRQSRSKAVMENKVQRSRKQPYMHLSRHLHAMRRPRGCGGRFLNTKEMKEGKTKSGAEKTGTGQLPQPTGSQSSEVLQSDSGNLNSPTKTSGSKANHSGSEVTSMFSMDDLNSFPISHFRPSVHSLSGMMNTGHGMFMSSKWVAADSCCNLKV